MTVVSLRLELFKKAKDLTDVAKILDLMPAHISYALYISWTSQASNRNTRNSQFLRRREAFAPLRRPTRF